MKFNVQKLIVAAASVVSAWASPGAVVLKNADWATDSVCTNGMGAAHYVLPDNVTNATFEAWVKPSKSVSGGNLYNYVFSIMGASSGPRIMLLLDGQTFKVYYYGAWFNSGAVVPLDAWTHLSAVRSPEGFTFYTNAVCVGTVSYAASGSANPSLISTAPFTQLAVPGIGSQRTGVNHSYAASDRNNRVFQGAIAEVRMWTKARNAEEIEADYGKRLVGNEDGLHLYVPFSDGQPGGTIVKNWAEGGLDLVVPPAQQLVEDATLDALVSGAQIAPDASGVLHSEGVSRGEITTDVKLSTSTYTLEAWVRLDAVPTRRNYIVGQYMTGNTTTWTALVVASDAVPQFFVGSSSPVNGKTAVSAGEWHHLAATRDASGALALYLDGELEATGSRSADLGAPPDNAIQLFNTGSNMSLEGSLREVRVWNYARSAGEIAAARMERLSGKEEGLVGLWPLDEESGSSVCNTVTGAANEMSNAVGGGWHGFTWLPARCLHSDRVSGTTGLTTDSKIATSDFTVETWARVCAPWQDAYFAGQYATGTANTTNWIALLFSGSDRKPVFRIGSRSGSNPPGRDFKSSTAVETGNWFHIAATREGTAVKVYLNGILVADGESPTTLPPPNAGFQLFTVGNGNNSTLNGELRETRLWSHARTQAQVVAAMNDSMTEPVDGLVASWPLNEGGTVVHDRVSKGLSELGTSNSWIGNYSAAPSLRPAVSEVAAGFDGAWFSVARTDTAVDVGDFTFEAWVRPTAWTALNRQSFLFAQWSTDTGNPNRFVIGFNDIDKFGLFIGDDAEGGTNGGWRTVDESVPLHRWTHVAATRCGSTLRLYLDGELKKTEPAYSTLSPWNASAALRLTLGGTDSVYAGNSGRTFHGQMREVRVWNRARSAEEIAANRDRRVRRNDAGLIGYWPLDEMPTDGRLANQASGHAESGYVLAGWDEVDALGLKNPPKGLAIVVR